MKIGQIDEMPMIYCGTNGHVFCLNEQAGNEIWRTKLTTSNLFSPAASQDVTVLLAGEVLIAASNGHMWGLSPSTGVILWHNGLPRLGNRFVTLCTSHVSIQYIHEHTTEVSTNHHVSRG